MKERIEKWKQMDGAGDPCADTYLAEIAAQAREEGKEQEMSELIPHMLEKAVRHLDNIETAIKEFTIREKLGDLAETINLAYIARHYFGKSRQWLYQRMKGQIVNGKPASFTQAEKETFIAALEDIRNRLGAVTANL